MARAVARGARIYGAKTLAAYVDEDRRVLDAIRPALVVGDLRWSLAVPRFAPRKAQTSSISRSLSVANRPWALPSYSISFAPGT